jgi:raffinose/stachyose/melibiose transport system permease protein
LKKSGAAWKIALTTLASAVALFPIYITIIVSLKPQTDLTSFWLPPRALFLENFVGAFVIGRLATAFMNTAIVTACSVLLVVLLSAMASYPLARHRSRLNAVVTTFMLSILMVPGLSLLVPLYVVLVHIRGISTYWGIVLIHVTFNLPLAIFLYLNFIRAIPRDFDDAALIDGSSVYAVFYRIVMPLLKPVTVSVIILSGVAVWNDYQFSLYFLQSPGMRVITLAISSFFAVSGGNTHMAAAAAVAAIVPITILYVALQKYFVQGVLDSALK